jgi:hypothetical protein
MLLRSSAEISMLLRSSADEISIHAASADIQLYTAKKSLHWP